jgi:hypothetical protein
MAFEWHAFVDFARRLAQDFPDDEAAMRSAVSRAYFGAFCHAKRYAVEKLGFLPGKEADDHGKLRAIMKGKLSVVGQRLQQLRELRNTADYDQEAIPDWNLAAGSAVNEADKILRQLPLP